MMRGPGTGDPEFRVAYESPRPDRDLSSIRRLNLRSGFELACGGILMQAVLPTLLITVLCLQPPRPDGPRTFYGRRVEGWLEVLRDKGANEAVRRQAAVALGCFGPQAKSA